MYPGFHSTISFSCGTAPLFAKVGKHEPVLLLLNTFTATLVFGCLLAFLSHKTDQTNKEYPIKEMIAYLVFIIWYCYFNFSHWDGNDDISSQLLSGLAILIFGIILIAFTFGLQRMNSKKAAAENDQVDIDC